MNKLDGFLGMVSMSLQIASGMLLFQMLKDAFEREWVGVIACAILIAIFIAISILIKP